MQQEYYSQAGMEQAIQELITKTINNERGGFNAMLAPRLVTVDWAAKSCTLAFHPLEWMSNPADFYVTSTIDHMGRRLNQTHCTMYLPNAPEKPCVTAVGTYYVLDEK